MKIFLIIILVCTQSKLCTAQGTPYKISFAALHDSLRGHPKPVIIKIGVSWCKYCHLQDKQIEKSPGLQRLLRDKFYFLELDAESREQISFNNKQYKFMPTGNGTGIHELALSLTALLKRESGYPTWILLDSNLAVIDGYGGFLDLLGYEKVKSLLENYVDTLKN